MGVVAKLDRLEEGDDVVQYAVAAGTAQKIDFNGAKSATITVNTTGDFVHVSTSKTNVDSGFALRLSGAGENTAWIYSLKIKKIVGKPELWLHSNAGTRQVSVIRSYG